MGDLAAICRLKSSAPFGQFKNIKRGQLRPIMQLGLNFCRLTSWSIQELENMGALGPTHMG